MPYCDAGERPWFCDKPGCHKNIWISTREHAKFHQKTCTLRFPNEAPLCIAPDVGGWHCPKCNLLFEGTPRGIRAIHAHAKSGDCLRASPMADSESDAMVVEPSTVPEVLAGPRRTEDDPDHEIGHDVSDLSGIHSDAPPAELDSVLTDSKDADEDAPMDIAPDDPDEVNAVAVEFDEKLYILDGNAALTAEHETPRAESISLKQSQMPLATDDKKVAKDEFTGRRVPVKLPLITLDTFLDSLRLSGDRPTVITKLRHVFETHGFSTPPKLDALFRNPPDFTNTRSDATMRDYEKTLALGIVDQVSLGAWLAVRAGIVARAGELGVCTERLRV